MKAVDETEHRSFFSTERGELYAQNKRADLICRRKTEERK